MIGDSNDILSRVKRLLPNRWFAYNAANRDAIIGALSDLASWGYGLVGYAKAQSRLATAYGIWLDIIANDFLGTTLTRDGLQDDTFRAIIKATILQERVTRKAMSNVVNALLGRPKITTELLLHFEDLSDASGNGSSAVLNGTAALVSSNYKFGGKSASFDGTDTCYVSVADQPYFVPFADFTIDFWFNLNDATSESDMVCHGAGWGPYVIAVQGGNLSVLISSNGTAWDIMSASAIGVIASNTWYHLALVRSGNSFMLFLNGNLLLQQTSSQQLWRNSAPLTIGGRPANFGTHGMIDEFRFSSIALWISDFTPPDRAFSIPTPLTIFEPWNTSDTGAYSGGGTQYGSFGYGVGQGGYGSMQLPAQTFLTIHRSLPSGVPSVGGYNTGADGYGVGAGEYIANTTQLVGLTDDKIYQVINLTKPTGSTQWVAFV